MSDKIQNSNIFSFIAKNQNKRDEFVLKFHEAKKELTDIVIYVCPKKNLKHAQSVFGKEHFLIVSYESLTDTKTWLHINNVVSENTLLIMDRPSRYPKITSDKVLHLQRLSMNLTYKLIVDIVPFTMDIEFVYTPYNYLNRNVLGYAHYYAFKANYEEMDENGNIVNAHDYDNLAKKIMKVSAIDYSGFTRPRTVIECPVTDVEMEQYMELRNMLFETEKTPQRIITQLSDKVHAFESRYEALKKLLAGLTGKTVVLTNLASYADKLKPFLPEGAKAVSYQSFEHLPEGIENVIYFESPIVKNYLMMDVESEIPEGCNVFHFLGNTKVDIYLYGVISKELAQIDGLTKEMGALQ